ncbi:unnamed protein product [Didymodactylos carnosus]|uniref:Uncharacterized protein n=1 Tax=Didymodactylos carnosus TaxID=1234261 RepID=A0A816E250_9BILA|nr:unnamed protein product [Didymodactylos carnosus]CAF1644211.1 unnamed protein product [Didymodactylos carnosus]CAF3672768.1 unnamed protein product [Didymodactylos carnosus]CAF4561162.1 unnamed protein product [Didymodactylos carnosus]
MDSHSSITSVTPTDETNKHLSHIEEINNLNTSATSYNGDNNDDQIPTTSLSSHIIPTTDDDHNRFNSSQQGIVESSPGTMNNHIDDKAEQDFMHKVEYFKGIINKHQEDDDDDDIPDQSYIQQIDEEDTKSLIQHTNNQNEVTSDFTQNTVSDVNTFEPSPPPISTITTEQTNGEEISIAEANTDEQKHQQQEERTLFEPEKGK